ncbi:MAG: hypothetical protein IJN54_12875 [Lachnospiraceae bacterium]|nr:hypothetical protein [Lachnospiraceae bacterium]
MNKYMKNLNRIEFVVTMACTGRCRHCSEGEHISKGEHIDGEVAAKESGIPKRDLITNGFFSKDKKRIKEVAHMLAESGVNKILLSVDAFHQETIPMEPVTFFAECVKKEGLNIRINPAWLVSKEDENPYNIKTKEILREFEPMGIQTADGNIIFPSGNAKKYLSEYFDENKEYVNRDSIMDIIDSYVVRSMCHG